MSVEVVEIDALELEALQAGLARLLEMCGPAIGCPLIEARPQQPTLRRDHEVRRIRMQRLRDQPLGNFGTVGIGGIDEIYAEFDGAPQHADRLLFVLWRSPNSAAR